MGKDSKPVGRLYMDALGDPGRSDGSLPTYAVCTVWVPNADNELETIFADVRQSLNLRQDYEFHARRLTSRDWTAEMPKQFFEALIAHKLKVECWCAEVQKDRSRLPLHIAGNALTYELLAQTLIRIPANRGDGLTLITDGDTRGKKVSKLIEDMRKGVKQALADKGHTYTLGKMTARPAHQRAGLQLADFVAAALVKPWPDCKGVITRRWKITHWKT